MKKIIKPAILLLTHLLVLQVICGQAPSDMRDYLSQRFLEYCKSVPREEIFIHSDRDEYIAGEDIWFNIYLIDRQSFKPSFSSRIAYLELLNSENRPVVQKRILIDKGFGPGQILLPDTLSSGKYTMRAYTSWMKNFLPYNCFVKEIEVYNTLSNKTLRGHISAKKRTLKGSDNIDSHEFKNSGLTLSVNNSKPDVMELNVNAENKFRIENNNLFYIFIQTHGNINLVSSEKMIDEATKITVPKTSLSPGINQITIFNSKGEPVCERFIYTPERQNNILTLNSADSCGLRNKITLDIGIGIKGSSELNSTNLSISVVPQSNDPEMIDINDYLVFGTEFWIQKQDLIKGIELSKLSHEGMDSILLNVRSNWIDWKEILSGNIPHYKFLMEKEDNFLFGKLLDNNQKPVISSEILIMCKPGKNASFQYARTDKEGNFSFNINIDESLKDLVIMPDDITKNPKIIIESSFSDQYLSSVRRVDSSTIQIPHHISKLSVNHQVQKIYGTTSLTGSLDPIFQPLKPTRFYGTPDIELILANYINLPVMGEIFFELLPGVSMKKKKSVYEISITDRVGDELSVTYPVIMIDGVIIKDASLIANIDPEIVEKIDVIKGKYLVGKYFFSGIVNVITKSGDFSCVLLPDYMTRLHYRVLDPVGSFISPDYSSDEKREDRIPDYRNTLYWNPAVKPDKEGKASIKFWSSDNKSDYVINIQGLTQEGNACSIRKLVKVK